MTNGTADAPMMALDMLLTATCLAALKHGATRDGVWEVLERIQRMLEMMND